MPPEFSAGFHAGDTKPDVQVPDESAPPLVQGKTGSATSAEQASTSSTRIPAPGPPISAITVKYNKFDDRTLISLDLGEFTDDRGHFHTSLLTSYSGKSRPQELRKKVCLHIYRYGQGWEFLNEHQIRIVCGDDRIEHNHDHYDSDMKDGDCNEYLSTYLDRDTLKKYLAKN